MDDSFRPPPPKAYGVSPVYGARRLLQRIAELSYEVEMLKAENLELKDKILSK